ncbi:MAG TPA: hypothetical protein VK721_06675 [Solirubrobacteraceae bacterium]|nr:hypothetical protein [Solirubrobacteraceae bacterium]
MAGRKATSKRLYVPPAAAITLALTCVGLISACGSSGTSGTTTKSLDVARVERAIEQSIMNQRHLKSKIDCPAKVLQKPGKFACIATTFAPKKPHREVKTGFLVTIHNDKGYVTYVGK